MIARILREPLLHFLLLGVGLFAVYAAVGPDDVPPTDEIVVTRGQIDMLSEGFARTWLRAPTAQELSALIDEHVLEEIYYREALALGLDRDDTVIRRRLRQKMEFLSDDTIAGLEPSDAELQAYLELNAGSFARPARTSFQQVFFSRERRGDAARADAERALARLASGSSVAIPAETGDATLLPAALESADALGIANAFGEEFAQQLAQAPVGSWSGPLQSAFGLHLVRVTRRDAGAAPTLDEARAQVASAWQAEQRARAHEALLAQLRSRYTVKVEP